MRKLDHAASVAPALLREPYGHCGGVLTMSVGGVGAGANVRAVVEGAARGWVDHVASFAEELAGITRFEEWDGSVTAAVATDWSGGLVVLVAGCEDDWVRDSHPAAPWRVLRTAPAVVARHLWAAGLREATVRKPKALRPAGGPEGPRASLCGVERFPQTAREGRQIRRALAEAALAWVAQAGEPIGVEFGRFPLVLSAADAARLLAVAVDHDVRSLGCVSVGRGPLSRGAHYSYGEVWFSGSGPEGADPAAVLDECGERLASIASCVDWACVPCPEGSSVGSLTLHDLVGAGDRWVLDASWSQILTDCHLEHAPAVRPWVGPLAEQRWLARFGSAADWLTHEAHRRVKARQALGACIGTRDDVLDHGHQRSAALSRSPRSDPTPEWAIATPAPAGMTKQSSWVWREWLENADYYSEAWRSDDGRWVTLEQRAPGQKPSDGNRPIEVAPGIILRSMPGSDGGGGFLWQQGGRSYSVSGGVESQDLVRQTAVAMYEAARSNA